MTRGSYWWWVAGAVGMFAVIGALVLIERDGEPDRLALDPSPAEEVGEPAPALESGKVTITGDLVLGEKIVAQMNFMI